MRSALLGRRPADAAGFVAALKELPSSTTQATDVGYPANADLVIATRS